MSTISTIQNTNHQNTNYIQIITKETTNISTRKTCPDEEVSSYVLLSWDVFHSKGVLLHRYGPTGTLGRSGTTHPLGTSRAYGPSEA